MVALIALIVDTALIALIALIAWIALIVLIALIAAVSKIVGIVLIALSVLVAKIVLIALIAIIALSVLTALIVLSVLIAGIVLMRINIMNELESFIQGSINNSYIEHMQYKLYLRKGEKIIYGKRVKTLEIGQIVSLARGQNRLKIIITELEKKAKMENRTLYIECVMAVNLTEFLVRENYIQTSPRNWVPPNHE